MTALADSTVRPLAPPVRPKSFDDEFAGVFRAHYQRIYRYLDRVADDADAAEDLAQEAFVRLYRRGSLPDEPAAWLITVSMNLLRNMKTSSRRRAQIVTAHLKGQVVASHRSPEVDLAASEARVRVRTAVDSMSERDRNLLLLRAEGYSYRELADALDLNVNSVGTLLARAQRSFRERYGE